MILFVALQMCLVVQNVRLTERVTYIQSRSAPAASAKADQQVVSGPPLVCGGLFRQSPNSLWKKWKLYFAELRRTHLIFFRSEENKEPLAFIAMDQVTSCVSLSSVPSVISPPTSVCFQLTVEGAGQPLYLSVADISKGNQWVDGILSVINPQRLTPYLRQDLTEPPSLPSPSVLQEEEFVFSSDSFIARTSSSLIRRAVWRGTTVAVKAAFVMEKKSAEEMEAFHREVAMLRNLCHPHILLYLGSYTQSDGAMCLVTEYLPTGDLYHYLHSDEHISESRKVEMALDIARGLSFLHSSSPPILHRDLKSPNLLLTGDYRVKLADFGLARVCSDDSWMTGLRGTAAWMSPEMFLGTKYGPPIDIYSYGVILWELCTRQRPFEDISFVNLICQQVLDGKRPPLPSNTDPFWASLIQV
jgi:hypothetical protein